MNKGNKRYRPKSIKRYDHTGALVNYGILEVGIVTGIRCLGSKESLLLVGAGLAKQKVPDYFYTQHYVRVPMPDQSVLKIYAIKSTDVSGLAGRISARVQLKKAEVINARSGLGIELWVDGKKICTRDPLDIESPQIELEPPQMKIQTKRVSKFRKAWLLVKRLFRK